jgi:ribosomal protein S18 acetylase RimI-like enzyme
MAALLIRETFDASKLTRLEHLDCGKNEFGVTATRWIRCLDPEDSALESMSSRGTQVFLYCADGTDRVIGFGSIGLTTMTVKKVAQTWSIVPHLGVHRDACNYAADEPWYQRYGAQIMCDLMAIAVQHGTEKLVLYVHETNKGARKLYANLGFAALGNPNGQGFQKMIVGLPCQVASPDGRPLVAQNFTPQISPPEDLPQ